MNQQRRKIGRRFLCVLVAAMVSLLLVVLPFAQTLDASDSGRHSGGTGLQDSGAAPDFEYEDPDIIVTANLSDHSAIPADAEFCVEPITQEKDSAAFQDVETQISKDVKADHQTVTGFRAYNIYFSANGTRYEPESGDVTVTIQYRDRVFDSAVKKATDEIKVLHLKETNGKTKVEDVTKAVDVKDLGGDKAKKATSSSEAVSDADVKDGSENHDGDTVKFVTKSFSTFVVTALAKSSTLTVTMNFYQTNGTTPDTVVTGDYYLCVETGNYFYTVPLHIGKGTGTCTIPGLYPKNNNSLTPLMTGTYSMYLFQSAQSYATEFQWDNNTLNNHRDITQYVMGSTIAERYSITGFPSPQQINFSSGTGTLAIQATGITSKAYSTSDIMNRLSPTLPFGVFASYFDLSGSEVEGCIAADSATIQGDFGNKGNLSNYQSSANTITVTKTYDGTTPKIFTFGLFQGSSTTPVSTQTLTLPSGGQNSGTITFNVGCGNPSDYTVNELDSNNHPIPLNSITDGFKLTKAERGTVSTLSYNWTSYIRTFANDCSGLHYLMGDQSKLVAGSGTVGTYNQFPCFTTPNGTIITCNSKSVVFQTANPNNFPIDFTGVLKNMGTLSTDLAQMKISSDTVIVKNFKASDFSGLPNNAFQFTIPSGKMLLLNIDASNCQNVNFPYQMVVNGENSGGWANVAPNIIVNVVTKDGSGNYVPYSGSIGSAFYMMGTLLAPGATIHCGAVYNGRLIGKKVYNDGQEIHSITTGGQDIPWTFVNTSNTCTPYTLPETGGGGTAIFYTTGGAVLLFGAVLAFVYRLNGKRRHIRKRRRNSLNE